MSAIYRDNGGKNRIARAVKNAQEAVATQVAVDSNKYIAKDSGALESSVFSASDFAKGRVVWATKYARRVYHDRGLRLSRAKNPNASHLWFEVAKSQKLSSWCNIAKNAIKINL